MRKVYLLILIASLSLSAGAQSFIKFTNPQHAFGTVVDSGGAQTLQFIDSIYNTSNQQFSGIVQFFGRVNSTTVDSLNSIDFSSNPLDTSGSPGTARPINIIIPYGGNPAFVSGPNGVIIWPLYAGGSAGPADSIRVTVTKTYLAGIEEAPLAQMYIIQHGGDLDIQFADMANLVQQVSLYDLSGKRIFSGTPQQSQHIATGGWSEGVYFCEITTYKGERRTIKFVLQ